MVTSRNTLYEGVVGSLSFFLPFIRLSGGFEPIKPYRIALWAKHLEN
jgi:hypothetical protein